MRRFLALAALFSATAFAYPDASPWGSANPAADETCSSCHYDYDPVRDSAAVEIIGLPETASPGNTDEIGVRIASVEAAVSGFQLLATVGAFAANDETLEAVGTAVRSTRTATNDGAVEWTFSWQTPERMDEAVKMYLAVSASNNDQSPFGDTIHYRRFVVPVATP